MMVLRAASALLGAGLGFAVTGGSAAIHGRNGVELGPPPSVVVKTVTDVVGGHTITDNYRWLEDQNSPETREFLRAQMKYTDGYLSQLSGLRERITKRLTELSRVDQTGMPQRRAGTLFFTRRLAEENQASIYMRPPNYEVKGGARVQPGDVRLVDARKLSADANASVNIAAISVNAELLVYGVRHGGADEQVIHFYDVPKRADIEDELPLARYGGFGLTSDEKTLYYSKTLKDGTGAVFQHTVGSSADKDREVFGGTYKDETLGPLDLLGCRVSENGHWLIVTVSHGVPATREDILLKDLRKPDAQFEPLVYGVDSRFQLHMYHDDLFVSTDYNAPNGRVLRASLGDATTKSWPVVIPESKSPIRGLHCGRRLLCQPAERCEDRDEDLHAARKRDRRNQLPDDWYGRHSAGPRGLGHGLLHVLVIHSAADDLRVQSADQGKLGVVGIEGAV
jgi:prolyl oligopeptidase